jgi:hypothetical protein
MNGPSKLLFRKTGLTNQDSRFTRAVTVFLLVLGFAILANIASYFLLSTGYGIVKWNDGLVRFGFPFVVYEAGGIDGRSEFYWWTAVKNLFIAIGVAAAVACLWGLLTSMQDSSSSEHGTGQS